MHASTIKRIVTDPTGRFILTGSYDKTMRLWSVNQGKLLQTFRPPISAESEGKLYAVALSPDGRWAAAGGRTGLVFEGAASVYLFDRDTGRMHRRFGGLTDAIMGLAFSGDGTKLAILMERGGLRVVDTEGGQEVMRDTDYAGRGESVQFDKTGRLVTTCRDGFVRLYDSSLRPAGRHRTGIGQQPAAVRFSPDGTEIAVGFVDAPAVEILSAENLQFIHRPDTAAVTGHLRAVTWSVDGTTLCAAGDWRSASGSQIRCWPERGRGAPKDIVVSHQRVEDLAMLENGDIAFASRDPSWGVMSADGVVRFVRRTQAPDLTQLGADLRVDTTGSTIGIPWPGQTEDLAIFSFGQRNIQSKKLARASASRLVGPATKPTVLKGLGIRSGMNLGQLPAAQQAALQDKLHVQSSDQIRCLATPHNGSGFVVGSEWSLNWYDEASYQRRWHVEVASPIVAVNVAPGGKLIIAALADSTFRWFRVTDGKELVALFMLPELRRWIVWTPSGYYDASAGGDTLVGWHYNRGLDAAADFFRISHFGDDFVSPELMPHILEQADEDAALRQIGKTPGSTKAKQAAMQRAAPPLISILSPADGTRVSQSLIRLKVLLRPSSDLPITDVRVLLDGRVYQSRRLAVQVDAASEDTRGGEVRVYEVSVPPGGCSVSVVAQTELARSDTMSIRLERDFAPLSATGTPSSKARLLGLVVGVSEYEDSQRNLKYAAKDAHEFAAVMNRQKPALYQDALVKVLVDKEATRSKILEGLRWLKDISTASDIVIVYLAGHGQNDTKSGDYLFLPSDVKSGRIAESALTSADLRLALAGLPAKVVLFLDTCHSGNVWKTPQRVDGSLDKLVNQLVSPDAGVIVFAASTGFQSSLEGAEWENGIFTKAVLEGLSGEAEYNQDGLITVGELALYVEQRVSALTQGEQTPVPLRPSPIPDFPIAVVPGARIATPQPSPTRLALLAKRRRAVAKPLIRKPWFWATLSGVGLSVAVGIGVGVAAARTDARTDPRTDPLAGIPLLNRRMITF